MSQPLPSAQEPEKIRAMFDRVAPTYDLLNHTLSLGIDLRWRRIAAGTLRLRPGDRAADLCAGTLDMSVALRRAGARVLALDFSLPMLRGGEKKAARAGGLLRVQGDAMRLPLRAGGLDAATVAFGIRNVSSTGGCLREIHRVLRPGGRIAILEFAPAAGLAGGLFNLYFRHLLPRLGALISGDGAAYRYLPESVAGYLAPGEFLALLAEAGFQEGAARRFFPGVAVLYTAVKSSK
jgi:demethylmenaquinone methyltransferase/2-methoxy-6-polyprenyl-1,4-benzoquinol methylase